MNRHQSKQCSNKHFNIINLAIENNKCKLKTKSQHSVLTLENTLIISHQTVQTKISNMSTAKDMVVVTGHVKIMVMLLLTAIDSKVTEILKILSIFFCSLSAFWISITKVLKLFL